MVPLAFLGNKELTLFYLSLVGACPFCTSHFGRIGTRITIVLGRPTCSRFRDSLKDSVRYLQSRRITDNSRR